MDNLERGRRAPSSTSARGKAAAILAGLALSTAACATPARQGRQGAEAAPYVMPNSEARLVSSRFEAGVQLASTWRFVADRIASDARLQNLLPVVRELIASADLYDTTARGLTEDNEGYRRYVRARNTLTPEQTESLIGVLVEGIGNDNSVGTTELLNGVTELMPNPEGSTTRNNQTNEWWAQEFSFSDYNITPQDLAPLENFINQTWFVQRRGLSTDADPALLIQQLHSGKFSRRTLTNFFFLCEQAQYNNNAANTAQRPQPQLVGKLAHVILALHLY